MQSQCESHEGASVARLKSGADTLLFLATCSWTKTRGEWMLLALNGGIGRLRTEAISLAATSLVFGDG